MKFLTTIAQGGRVAVWDRSGRRTIVQGPRRIMRWGRRIEPLAPFVAGPTQYLAIEHRDGRVAHERGPSVVWLDPVEHLRITICPAIALDANEALVVYRQQDGRVLRRIVPGPEMFVPEPREWLHEFRWHGADPRDARKKVPRALTFTKLRTIPDQMYFDVESVRTADDALIVIKLMIFFELIDMAMMLDQTHDPIADFINAVTADVIDFAAALKFEEFKAQTDRLSARETYAQLAQRAGRIGYRINKVVYRGYQANEKLQAMHDSAIETRTRLRLDSENETQAQQIADLKLAREQERSARRQEMDRANAEHQLRMQRADHDERLRRRQADGEARLRQRQLRFEQRLQHRKTNAEMRVQHRQLAQEQRASFLRSIQELQVDLTQYLVARHQRPDRRIQIDGGRSAQLHLHEE